MKISIPFILSVIIFAFACNEISNVKKRDTIKKDKFLKILIDIHLAEGTISTLHLDINQNHRDSVSLYNFIFKKHNVSRTDFEHTINYYTYHSDEYVEIYDSLISYFKHLNQTIQKKVSTDIENERKEGDNKKDTSNLWQLKNEWQLPEDGKKNPIAFKIETEKHGEYSLSANIKLFPDDQSVNQKMTLIANYSDGTKDLNTAGSMVKDGKFELYTVNLITDNEKILKSISGYVLDHNIQTKSKHAHIKDISLKYTEKNPDSE